MHSVELFAGCGGLALGIADAGFEHALVAEYDAQAHATLLLNKSRGLRHVKDWGLKHGDVCEIDYSHLAKTVDLISGGPPCQPFSIGGKHKGPTDTRNMWPEAIRAVQELQPKAFVFENVRGLLRPAFEQYLYFLRLQLSYPEVKGKQAETWKQHLVRLIQHDKKVGAPSYRVLIQGINAADYGAPQKRHRAIVMGVRADVNSDFTFPSPTHTREKLLWNQYVTGEYWERHEISKAMRPVIAESDKAIIAELRETLKLPQGRAWITTRDALDGLPRPISTAEEIAHHLLHRGARIYVGHTGSTWDQPAKALKAGAHGVPGGENIIVSRKGSVRYFTIREMARLQGFPDNYNFSGPWVSLIRQLGNAVPVQVGRAFGREIYDILSAKTSLKYKKIA